MDVLKLKHIEQQDQIMSAIEKGADFGGDLWQNGLCGRKVFQIINLRPDYRMNNFSFRAFDLTGFDPTLPLFIRLCYRNIIFRLNSDSYRFAGDKIICQYPLEARALEPRKGARYVLPITSDISLSLNRADRKGASFDIEVKIIDVSEYGFGILISGANKDFLRKGDHFWIKAINQRPLYDQLYGSVTYVAPKGYFLKRGDVRVGLSLRKSISHEVLEFLKDKCHLVLGA